MSTSCAVPLVVRVIIYYDGYDTQKVDLAKNVTVQGPLPHHCWLYRWWKRTAEIVGDTHGTNWEIEQTLHSPIFRRS